MRRYKLPIRFHDGLPGHATVEADFRGRDGRFSVSLAKDDGAPITEVHLTRDTLRFALYYAAKTLWGMLCAWLRPGRPALC